MITLSAVVGRMREHNEFKCNNNTERNPLQGCSQRTHLFIIFHRKSFLWLGCQQHTKRAGATVACIAHSVQTEKFVQCHIAKIFFFLETKSSLMQRFMPLGIPSSETEIFFFRKRANKQANKPNAREMETAAAAAAK